MTTLAQPSQAPSMEKRNVITYLTEGVIIALATAIAYVIAFRYEAGYADYYNFPTSLISISLSSILVALGYLLAFSVFIFMGAMSLHGLYWRRIPEIIRRLLPQYIFAIIVLLAMLFFKDTRVSHIVILLVVLLPFLIPDFVIPVFMKAEGKTYLERVEIYWRQDVPSPSLMGSAMQKIGRHFFLWLFVIYGCTIVAGTAGHGNAANQREYWVLESDPNDVVLRIYDDVFIVGHRKGETNELDQSLRILRITNESGIKLIRADIGPLIAASTPPVDTPPSEKKPNKEPTRLKQNSK